MSSNKCDEALGYWTIGIQYLHLVETVIDETIKQGNPLLITDDHPISLQDYTGQTRWSDHKLIIPLLFDFYHGLEVLFKGFLIAAGLTFKSSHKLTDLLSSFETHFPNNNFGNLAKKYIDQNQLPEPLKTFCRKSGITIDEYYQALKYPESTKSKIFIHSPLKYHGGSGLPFFQTLAAHISQARKEAVALGRRICPTA